MTGDEEGLLFAFKILSRKHWGSQQRAEGMSCSRGLMSAQGGAHAAWREGLPFCGPEGDGETLRAGPEPPAKAFTTWGLGFHGGPEEDNTVPCKAAAHLSKMTTRRFTLHPWRRAGAVYTAVSTLEERSSMPSVARDGMEGPRWPRSSRR